MSNRFFVAIGFAFVMGALAVEIVDLRHRWVAQDACEERGGQVTDRASRYWTCVKDVWSPR